MGQHQREPAEPTLLAQARDRGGQEGRRKVEGSDDVERCAQQGG